MAITRLNNNALGDTAKQEGINFKNLIINGDMSIAQRSTSETGIGNGDTGYHTLDRWRFSEGSDNSTEFTMSQDTTVPTGQGFAKSLKMDVTTADSSPGSSDQMFLQQRFEGQNLQMLKKGTSSAEKITVSFWVRSTKTGTFILELQDSDNIRNCSQSYTISSADTWEKKEVVFPADTTGTIDNDNGNSFEVNWWLVAGSNFTSGTLATSFASRTNANRAVGQVNVGDSTSNNFYLTGCQMEVGTTASDFEFLPHDVNLQRCQRYYQKSYNIGTTAGTATSDGIMLGIRGNGAFAGATRLPVVMRTTPTLTIYSNITGASGKVRNAETGSDETASTNSASDNSFNAQGTTSGISNVYQYQYVAEAEL